MSKNGFSILIPDLPLHPEEHEQRARALDPPLHLRADIPLDIQFAAPSSVEYAMDSQTPRSKTRSRLSEVAA